MIELSGRDVTGEADFYAVDRLSRQIKDVWPKAAFEQTARAAVARDPGLLHVLERMAEVSDALDERMLGQSRRTKSEAMARVKATEATVWREAYRLVDQRQDARPLFCQVTAAAIWAGVVPRPRDL